MIMASICEKNKTILVIWFAKLQFLMFTIHIIRKYEHKNDEKIAKSAGINIEGTKRKN